MTASWLTWQICWRSALRILALGALFGGIYGPSVLNVLLFLDGDLGSVVEAPRQSLGIMLFAAAIGGLIGAVLGFLVGILIGALISAITLRAFLPLQDAPRYVRVVQWASTLVGAIGTLVGAPLLSLALFGASTVTREVGMLAIFSVVPALLAGLAIRRGSGQVAAWYVRAATASQSGRASPAKY